jgi:hypothetical protein
MKIKKSELQKVWKAFNMQDFPRMVGNPLQSVVYNEEEFFNWFMSVNGKRPCFTSHNSYPILNEQYNPPCVKKVCVKNLFTDFDDKHKQENAQLDTIKLIKFCQKENLHFKNQFSGSKGFHHFISLKPMTFDYADELKQKVRAIYNWLEHKLELRTMDNMCKEPRRLCRIPYSRYVKMEGRNNYIQQDNYCVPMTPEDIMDYTFDEIVEYSKHPLIFIPKKEEPTMNINDLISHFQIDVKKFSINTIEVEERDAIQIKEYTINLTKIVDTEFLELLKSVIPRMCVHNDLISNNPSHAARRMAVIQLKQIGYSFSQVVAMFEQMSKTFKWVDRKNQDTRIYQIKFIYLHNPPYMHDSCKKIKNEHSICVGKICPYYFEVKI